MYTSINQRIQNRLQKILRNLAQDFSVQTLSKSPARFNQKKLDWFNQQYIKSLSLEEFAWRAFDWRIQNAKVIWQKAILENPEKNQYRIGNYAYFVDFKAQKIFVSDFRTKNMPTDGGFYPLGGGQDEGETEIQGLIRELTEETEGRVNLKPEKAQKLNTIYRPEVFKYGNTNQEFAGKLMNIYIYPLKESQISSYNLEDETTNLENDWFEAAQVIQNTYYLGYPIWREYCLVNNLPVFEMNQQIQQNYLSYLLDQNRITTLADFGLESKCILNYQIQDKAVVKWKKISLQESLDNLSEIMLVVDKIYLELESEQRDLYNSIFENDVREKFQNLNNKWEESLKSWLTENHKNVGEYLWPLRTALSGLAKSPSPFEILSILTPEQARQRVNHFFE